MPECRRLWFRDPLSRSVVFFASIYPGLVLPTSFLVWLPIGRAMAYGRPYVAFGSTFGGRFFRLDSLSFILIS